MPPPLPWRILFLTTLVVTPFARALNNNEEYEPLAEQTRISRQIERDHDFVMSTQWGHQLNFSNNTESSAAESEKLQEMAAYLEQTKRERRAREAAEAEQEEQRRRQEAAEKWRKEYEAKQASRTNAWNGNYAAAMSLAIDKIEGRDDASPGKADWATALELIDRIKDRGIWPHVWAHSLQVARGYQPGMARAHDFLDAAGDSSSAEAVNLALVDLCEQMAKESVSYEEGQAIANVLANLYAFADQIPAPGLAAPTAAAIRSICRSYKVPFPEATEQVIDRAMSKLPGTPIDHYWQRFCPPAAPAARGYNSSILRVDAIVDFDRLMLPTYEVDGWRSLLKSPRTWRKDPHSLATMTRLLKIKRGAMLAEYAKYHDPEETKLQAPLLDFYIQAITAAPESEADKQFERWEGNHFVYEKMKTPNDAALAIADAAEGSYWGIRAANGAIKILLNQPSPNLLLDLASKHSKFFASAPKVLEPAVSTKLFHTLAANASTPARLEAALGLAQAMPLTLFVNEENDIVSLLCDVAFRLKNPKEALRLGRAWKRLSDQKRVISRDNFDNQMTVISIVDTLFAEKPDAERLVSAMQNAIEITNNSRHFQNLEMPFAPSGVVLRCLNQLQRLDYRAALSPEVLQYRAKLEATRDTSGYGRFITAELEARVTALKSLSPSDTNLEALLAREALHSPTAAAALLRECRSVPDWYPHSETFLSANNSDAFSLKRRAESACAALLGLRAQRLAKIQPDDDTAEARKWLEEVLSGSPETVGHEMMGRDLAIGGLLTRALLTAKSQPLDSNGHLSDQWLEEVAAFPDTPSPREVYPFLVTAAVNSSNTAKKKLGLRALEGALETGAEAHPEFYSALAANLDHLPTLFDIAGVPENLRREALETRLRWEFGRLNGFTTSAERGEDEVRRLGPAKAMALALALEAASVQSDASKRTLVIGDNPEFQWSLARAAARQLPDGILWLDRFSKRQFPSDSDAWLRVREGHLW